MDTMDQVRPGDLRQVYARLADIGRERLAAVEQNAPPAALKPSVSVVSEAPGDTTQQAAVSER